MASITLSDVTTRVANLLGSDAQLSTAEIQSIAIARYEILHDANAWSKRRKEFALNLSGVSANGADATILATIDSATVTSSSTPFTSANSHNKQIKIGSNIQYYFASFVSTSSLSLVDGNGNTTTWPDTTSSANGWQLFQTVYTIPSDADLIMSLAYNYTLDEIDGGRVMLDRWDPNRQASTSEPTHWCYLGINSSNVRQIEVWPVPTAAMTLHGQYLMEAPQISSSSYLNIHPAVMTYATAADCYNMLHSKTGDQSSASILAKVVCRVACICAMACSNWICCSGGSLNALTRSVTPVNRLPPSIVSSLSNIRAHP